MGKRKIPHDTPYFHYHNENPFGKTTSDCLYRAISLATGIGWQKTVLVTALWEVKNGLIPASAEEISSLLKEFGPWCKFPMPVHDNGTRYTIAELCKKLGKKKDPVLVRCSHHLTCIKDGKVWDIWNCTGRCCYNYWVLM